MPLRPAFQPDISATHLPGKADVREAVARITWPRRLVWCLPMRVLVEQTVEVAKALSQRMPEEHRPGVAVLMGGEDTEPWFLEPEKPWILIGTQDMLLSRALNRGYASGRATVAD